MSDLTPSQVVAELRRLSRKLEERTDTYVKQAQRAAEADAAHQLAMAKAMLVAEGSAADDRKAAAIVACEAELLAYKLAQALADATKEQVRSLRDQLTAVEAAGANLRSEMELAGRAWRVA